MNTRERAYYEKHLLLPEIAEEGQRKLKETSVLVVGCGGLGCPALLYLNAAGVGRIGIIDPDSVNVSNLHRQVLFSFDDVGKLKVVVAKEKLAQQNPYTSIECYPYALDVTNAESIIGNYDLIIDGSDNFSTRYLVNDTCVILNKPLISGSIERFEGQVSVYNYQNGPTYRCLYPEALNEKSADCSITGVIGVIPGIIGTLMATEAIKVITEIGEVLSGKLLVYDALNMSFKTYLFEPNDQNRISKLASSYGNIGCDINEIDFKILQEWTKNKKSFRLIDVREPHEHLKFNIGGENVILSAIENHCKHLTPEEPIVIYCQCGIRSKVAVQILREQGFNNLYMLKGGIEPLVPNPEH